MIPNYLNKDFDFSKSMDLLPLKCHFCNNIFYRPKKEISFELKHKRGRIKFCSQKCNNAVNNYSTQVTCICKNCNAKFRKKLSQSIKHSNHFCSKSCAATYNNKNKSHGNRRSKLEQWLQEQLSYLYPDLDIHYNQKSAIGSELDIYIPSLNIAFELNGIFHYEPIYGVDKLTQIQANDISKSKACHEAKIDLCIIDTSGQKYVKPSTSQKYLDIIKNIIKERLLTS